MSKAQLGIWDYGWSICAYIALATSSLGSATGHYVGRYATSKSWDLLNRTLGATMALMLYGCAIATALTFVITACIPSLIATPSQSLLEDAKFLVFCMGLASCLGTLTMVYGGVLVGRSRFDLLNIVGGVSDLLMIVGLFVCILAGGGLTRSRGHD